LKTGLPGDGGFNVANLNQQGVLATANWAFVKEITDENKLAAGHDLFRLQCQSCHTQHAYRGMKKLLQARGWNEQELYNSISRLDKMVNGTMPPFVGTNHERKALAAFLVQLSSPSTAVSTGAEESGDAVFQKYCSSCHEKEKDNELFTVLQKQERPRISYLLTKLDSLNEGMPPFTGTDAERDALAEWIVDFK
jgi:mono/diheme cytochrome c family protein